MNSWYSTHSKHYVAVDCIIFGLRGSRLSVLLAQRSFEPEKGKWSLMGGFVEADESIDSAATRVLRQLTGLDHVYMWQVGAFGAVDRDPGERVVSVAYNALLNTADVDERLLQAHNAIWVDLGELPELGFDHPLMIECALKALRRRMAHEPLAFRLLGPEFTLTRLQELYEVVNGESLDKRNFRKRVAENACIEPTGHIDKAGSRRGAMLYRFNPETYSRLGTFKL
ncbi:MAG: NUDIX domain-containing protein [Muribaculaceae bacterium]|nr:NUDIX domain-containing protein [Muribaculaceae bacterium]